MNNLWLAGQTNDIEKSNWISQNIPSAGTVDKLWISMRGSASETDLYCPLAVRKYMPACIQVVRMASKRVFDFDARIETNKIANLVRNSLTFCPKHAN